MEGGMHGEQTHRDRSNRSRDGSEAYNARGTVVVAGAWLAFYAAGAIYTFMSTGNVSKLPADHTAAAASIRADGIVRGK
jgi:hypothetical protein